MMKHYRAALTVPSAGVVQCQGWDILLALEPVLAVAGWLDCSQQHVEPNGVCGTKYYALPCMHTHYTQTYYIRTSTDT